MRQPLSKTRHILLFAAIVVLAGTPAQGFEFGPHQLTVDFTPLAQWNLNQEDTGTNAEADIIGSFRLREGDTGGLGDTRFGFWVLGNMTLGDTLPTAEFAQRAGLLWDTNDGDAPVPSWILAIAAIQQDVHLGFGDVTLEAGKLYPGSQLAASSYYGDDRDTFFSQMLGSDVAGRWYDTIGLGVSMTVRAGPWYGGFVVTDATAEDDILDFESLENGDFMKAVELGVTVPILGRATRLSVVPYHVDTTAALSAESGLVLSFQHDLTATRVDLPADIVLFGRYTFRDGGNPRNDEADELAKPVDHGGFLGVAFNRPFGYDAQQVGIALMQGSPSKTLKSEGFGAQQGIELFWKIAPLPYSALTFDFQAVTSRDDGVQYIPGLRLKLKI